MKSFLVILSFFFVLSSVSSAFAMGSGGDDGCPPEHFCAITLSRMVDPVVAADGNTYEREAITAHFQVRQTSPLTNQPIPTHLIPNNALKKMIDEWRPGGVRRASAFEGRRAVDIVERIRREFEINQALLGPDHTAFDRDIVAVLGNTGSGKSTLVNLIAGKELRVSEDGEDYVLVHPEDPEAMAIGVTGGSQTLYPKSIDVEGLRIFDLPGFNDTDGSERNLVNAALIRHILMSARSVRLVVVAGQDQFTSDRSASIKQMMQAIQNLFVIEGQDQDLLNEALFVATKVTTASSAINSSEGVDFLLKKSDARDKEELGQQLRIWKNNSRLLTMFHPLRDADGTQRRVLKEELLERLQTSPYFKIRSLNVSALYPPETVADLKRVFMEIMETELSNYVQKPLRAVSDYDREIDFCGGDGFWRSFEERLCEGSQAVHLLKDFGTTPYAQALRDFTRDQEQRRKGHHESLIQRRERRIEDVQERTEDRFDEVVAARPQAADETEIVFDFGYQKDFYEAVAGERTLPQLATDPREQEIVRQCCTSLINQRARVQIERSLMESPLVRTLMDRIKTLERRLPEEAGGSGIVPVPRPLAEDIPIPEMARGFEDIYRRFVMGRLIYKPDPHSDEGRVELPIRDLANPLEGEFDLSRCGDSGRYLSINTGYRKRKRPENKDKVEIWLAPRFLIEKELQTSAGHFQPIMSTWNPALAPVGLFWTWGGWNDMGLYDYLTINTLVELADDNLYDMSRVAHLNLADGGAVAAGAWFRRHGVSATCAIARCFMFHL